MSITESKSHFSIWKLFLSALCVVIISIVAFGVIIIKDVKDIDIDKSITISIPDGAGASVVADILHENNVIKYPTVFKICSKVGNFDGQYKPGTITISNGMSYNSILRLLA